MRIAIFGRNFSPDFHDYALEFFNRLQERGAEVIIFKPFYDF
jgi:predicted nicotinamide N-methyase